MTQLILDTGRVALSLPESQKGGYTCYKEILSDDVEMLTGRLVKEIRGSVWHVSYQYGFFNDDNRKKLMEICERGRNEAIRCSFLPQDSDEALTSSSFYVVSFTRPKFMWSSEDKPMWADFSIELREVEPSD